MTPQRLNLSLLSAAAPVNLCKLCSCVATCSQRQKWVSTKRTSSKLETKNLPFFCRDAHLSPSVPSEQTAPPEELGPPRVRQLRLHAYLPIETARCHAAVEVQGESQPTWAEPAPVASARPAQSAILVETSPPGAWPQAIWELAEGQGHLAQRAEAAQQAEAEESASALGG